MTTYDEVSLDLLKFGIVLNDVADATLNDEPPVGGGWTLRRAPGELALTVRAELAKFALPSLDQVPGQERKISRQGDGTSSEQLLNVGEWRYSIVQPDSAKAISGKALAEALRISDADLWVESWCIQKKPGSYGPDFSIGGSAAGCSQYFMWSWQRIPPVLDVDHIRTIVDLRASFDVDAYPSIARAIEMFRELDSLPPLSPAQMLGHFGVLESLLSHVPEKYDLVDSITKQLCRNLILIHHRLPPDTNFELDELPGVDAKTVISRLYAYRSALAHGGDASKALQWFDPRWPDRWKGIGPLPWFVHGFVRQMTRRLLQFALQEPVLVSDLRA